VSRPADTGPALAHPPEPADGVSVDKGTPTSPSGGVGGPPSGKTPVGRAASRAFGPLLTRGAVTLYLSMMVLIPLAAVVVKAFEGDETRGGLDAFWQSVTAPASLAALELTLIVSLIVTAINAVMGTLIAWVLVRDDFRGKSVVNAVIDLPFALPTIVAGATLLALYGPNGPIPGVNIVGTQIAIVLALLFVTLPFVVRAVQPVLMELERDVEEAAASLGANRPRIFRSVILPSLVTAMVAGCGLAFARAIGEFGSVVLIAGNEPFETQVSSVYIFGLIESGSERGAAGVAVALLVISLLVLTALSAFGAWRARRG
jgi:sulfate/thiosulfate transport system permease protein